MDDDLADLMRQLLTRAGMIMEDASTVAVLTGSKPPDELRSICQSLQAQVQTITALLAAAATLAAPESAGIANVTP